MAGLLGPFYEQASHVSSTSTLKTEIDQDEINEALQKCGLELVATSEVRWKYGSVQHPRFWPQSKKLFNITILIAFEFFS